MDTSRHTLKMCSSEGISLCDICFGFYIFVQICCSSSFLAELSLILFVLSVMYSCRHVKFSIFTVCEIIFIFYHIIHLLFGITVVKGVAWQDFFRVLCVCVVNFCVYNYILKEDNINKILDVYIFSALLAFLILLLFYGTDLGLRAGAEDYTIGFLGIVIDGGVATRVGMGSAIAFFVSFFRYYKKNNMYLWFCSIVFMLATFFSGTRKVLLIVAAAVFFVPLAKERKVTKKTGYLIAALVVFVIAYEIVINVPIFYETVGRRLLSLINHLQNGSQDRSAQTRFRLLREAQNAFNQRPIWGWGLENFRQLFDGRLHCHNNFWEMLVSGGVVGFVLFYIKYIFLYFTFWKYKKRFGRLDFLQVCLLVLIVSMTILEYWQRTYNQLAISIVYMIVFAFMKLPPKNSKLV